MTLIIMAAGMGSRFGGLKQLTPVTDDGEFILDFTVYDARRAGFDKFVFIIREEHEEIFEEKIGAKLRRAGINIKYVFQKPTLPAPYVFPPERKKPLGTGHAILSAGLINEPFAVVNADDFYGKEPFEKLAAFLSNAKDNEYCMVGYRVKNTLSPNGSVSRGICVVDDASRLLSITEYKKIERRGDVIINTFDDGTTTEITDDQLVSMTCFGFMPSFCRELCALFDEFLEQNRGDLSKCEFYLPVAVQKMLDAKYATMTVLDTHAEWRGVTYREDSEPFRLFIRELKKTGAYPKNLF